MTALSSLPPAFLLPAWSYRQLANLSSGLIKIPHHRHFSKVYSRLQKDEEYNPESSHPKKIFTTFDTPQGRVIAQTYAYRRENRYLKSTAAIKRRIFKRKNDDTPFQANQAFRRRHEETLIAKYLEEKETAPSQPLRPSNFETHGHSSNRNTLRMYLDHITEGHAVLDGRIEEKHPQPIGSTTFESLDPQLYPSVKRVKLVRQKEQPQPYQSDPSAIQNGHSKGFTAPNRSVLESGGYPVVPEAGVGVYSDHPSINSLQEVVSQEKSLLEELFPEQAAKAKSLSGTSVAFRHVEPPELALPSIDDLRDDTVLTKQSISPRRIITTSTQPLKPVPTLLVLENALPNLIEADFQRISPKGTHIEEWKSTFDPVAIIPERTSNHGQCTGKYYLIFRSPGHAKTWRSRVELLHKVARLHASNSLVAPLIPPKGFTTLGEDVGETLREYSLFAQGAEPIFRMHSDPRADPTIKKELDMIMASLRPLDRSFQPGRSVLLWIEGWNLGNLQIIKKMIYYDGRARNAVWGDMQSSSFIDDYQDQIPQLRISRSETTSQSMPQSRRWLFTLSDEAEARRFVRAWHNRPFPQWLKHKVDDLDEPWPLVKTELIW